MPNFFCCMAFGVEEAFREIRADARQNGGRESHQLLTHGFRGNPIVFTAPSCKEKHGTEITRKYSRAQADN